MAYEVRWMTRLQRLRCMHELTIRLCIGGPETGMIEAVRDMTILTVVGLSRGIVLLPLGGVEWIGRA